MSLKEAKNKKNGKFFVWLVIINLVHKVCANTKKCSNGWVFKFRTSHLLWNKKSILITEAEKLSHTKIVIKHCEITLCRSLKHKVKKRNVFNWNCKRTEMLENNYSNWSFSRMRRLEQEPCELITWSLGENRYRTFVGEPGAIHIRI